MFFGGTQNCGKLSYVQLMGCSRRVIYPLAPILTVNPSTNSETGESETAIWVSYLLTKFQTCYWWNVQFQKSVDIPLKHCSMVVT